MLVGLHKLQGLRLWIENCLISELGNIQYSIKVNKF